MFDFNELPSLFPFTAAVGLLVVSCAYIFRLWESQKKYAPGPKGLPFFGTRLSSTPWKDFEQWGKRYGDIMYIKSFGKGILVLNSHSAAVDLLDRRGGNYSDRQIFIVNEYLTRGLSFGLANYGDMWRKMRRAGHECLSRTGVTRYYQVQQREALIFTENLLRDSKQWDQEVYRTAASGLLTAVYDMPPRESANDPIILKFNDFHEILISAVSPGVIEYFPWLQHLPAVMAPWKKKAQKGYLELSSFFMELFGDVKRQMDGYKENPGFAEFLVREQDRLGLNETESAWLAANITAGFGSSTEALLWLFLAMIAYPEKQRKCQEELDAVVGQSRMPTFEDKDNLPYLKATVRELLRWRAISPLGNEHLTKEDDWYQGYFIPKGTMCLANIWLMNRNPDIYGPDVEDFNPDRFIDDQGHLMPALNDTKDGLNLLYAPIEGHASYGFGPRLCPARHLANDTIFIIIARLLWSAKLSPVFDKQTGKPILPDLTATIVDGVKSRPLPFDVVVTPRFAEAAEMVARTRELSG